MEDICTFGSSRWVNDVCWDEYDWVTSQLTGVKRHKQEFCFGSIKVKTPLDFRVKMILGQDDREVQTIRYKISYKDILYNTENIANIL